MWQCGVCGLIYDGDSAPAKCPKCGAPAEKFTQLAPEAAATIERARLTNYLQMELATLATQMLKLAQQGLADKLDPGCVTVFTKAQQAAWELRQMAMAEIATHKEKQKWG